MHWGQRRYQNEDGSYKPGAEGRYYMPTKLDQKLNYKRLAKAKGPWASEKRTERSERMARRILKESDLSNFNAKYKARDEALANFVGMEDKVELKDRGYDYVPVGGDVEGYNLAQNQYEKAQKEYYDECKKVAERMLGKYGNMPISGGVFRRSYVESKDVQEGVSRAFEKLRKQQILEYS